MDNFLIEKLTKKYVKEVYKLEQELIGSTSVESIMKTLESESLSYYVLLEESKVVGFFECSILPPESELFDIAVNKEKQGRGYSKILMDYFLNLVKQNNCDTVLLEVNSINNKAINLYEKFGFKSYGKRKNYYGENDAILMKLEF